MLQELLKIFKRVDKQIKSRKKYNNLQALPYSHFLPNYLRYKMSFKRSCTSESVNYGEDLTTNKKEDYRIVICQDGKFAVTFDTAGKK